MKRKSRFLIALLLLFLSSGSLRSQSGYSPGIDSVISLCTSPALSKLIREFSGDTATVIGGVPYTLLSRYSSSTHNPKAAQFIYERFQSFGLQPKYMNYSANGSNVYAVKTGTKYPNKQYIICAHYDDMPSGPLAPGAGGGFAAGPGGSGSSLTTFGDALGRMNVRLFSPRRLKTKPGGA